MARARGMFPVVTCTQRDPQLEFEAARELISYQAECLIVTGATDPDRISNFCAGSGVQSINLDLPGSGAPSIISDNEAAAFDLTNLILDRCQQEMGWIGPLRFVGGRLADHNTSTRLSGFLSAHKARGMEISNDHVLAAGYSAESAARVLAEFQPNEPTGLFVNSTISLEGVVRWHSGLGRLSKNVRYGCFDWDPFGSFLPGNVGMVEQDVTAMLTKAFSLINRNDVPPERYLVPCKLRVF